MTDIARHWIDAAWLESELVADSHNPATGELRENRDRSGLYTGSTRYRLGDQAVDTSHDQIVSWLESQRSIGKKRPVRALEDELAILDDVEF